jgi:hypothetical protein
MPDATNPEHLEILRSVLSEEFNISKYETDQFIFLLMEDALVPNPNPNGRKKMVTKAYAARWNKDKGGAAPEEDPEDDTDSKEEPKKKSAAKVAEDKKFNDAIDKIKDPEKKKKAKEAKQMVDDFDNAETPEEKKAALQAMADSGLFAINGMGVETNKFYINSELTGLPRKLIGNDNKRAKEMHKAIAEAGVEMPVRGSRTGQNRFGPGNLLGGVGEAGGGKATSSPIEIEETEDGGVIVGGTKFTPTPPLTDKQKAKRREQYKSAGKTEEEIDSLIRQEESHRDWNNRKIEALKNGEVEALDIKDENGNIQDTATEEGRKGAIKAVAKRINDRFKALLGDDLNKKSMRHVKRALNDFQQAAEDYANGDITAEEYQAAQEKLKVELERNEETSGAMPNIEETFDAMKNWSQGRHTILPSASNFPVGDIWSFDPTDLPEDATPEQIAKHIQIITSSHGLTSIKEGKGGASQSENKISQSKYAAYKKKDGTEVSAEEVTQDLTDLSGSNYADEWNDDDPQGGIDRAEAQTDELMEKYGLTDDDIGITSTDTERWATNAKKYAKATAKKYGISEEAAEELLLRRYQNHDRAVSLMAHINNETVESQGFTNISHNYENDLDADGNRQQEADAEGNPRVKEDAEGNPILSKSSRNGQVKGEPIKLWKRKEVNDETNGGSVLACMEPKKDPGFKAPYGVPNNRRSSHIKSCKNKQSS